MTIRHIASPTRVEAAGTPPKLIDEYVGRVNSGTSRSASRTCAAPPVGPSPGRHPSSTSTPSCSRARCSCGTRRRVRGVRGSGRDHARGGVGAVLHPRRRRVHRRVRPGLLPRHRPPRRVTRPCVTEPYSVRLSDAWAQCRDWRGWRRARRAPPTGLRRSGPSPGRTRARRRRCRRCRRRTLLRSARCRGACT